MKGITTWILVCIVIFNSIALYGVISKKKPKTSFYPQPAPVYPQPQFPQPSPPAPAPEPARPTTPVPNFVEWKPVKSVSNLGKILSDIESHMPDGHIYKDSDKITWGHETTHGINSNLRNKHQSGPRVNGFYVLENRGCIIQEPKTTISAAAALVPRSLRGNVYQLYMVSQAASWNNTPLYVFDEWVAYANGSAVRADLGIQQRQETVQQMLEFNNYAIAVAMAAKTDDPQFKNFLMWHLERSMQLYEANKNIGDTSRSTAFLELTRTSSDAESMREFARNYFGKEWTKQVLGY